MVEEVQGLGPEPFAEIERLLEADAPAASDRAASSSVPARRPKTTSRHFYATTTTTSSPSRIEVRCELGSRLGSRGRRVHAHRLAMAGIDSHRFAGDAVREVVAVSHGIPRLINVVCDRALATASLLNLPAVGGWLVRECAETFGPPGGSRSVVRPDWAEGAARRLGGGAKPPWRALVVIIVGLVAVGVILPAGYAYRRRGEARWQPVPCTRSRPPVIEGVTRAPRRSSDRRTTGPGHARARPAAECQPGAGAAGSGGREQRRTPPLPSSDSASVRGREQRSPPDRPGTRTGRLSGAAPPEGPPVVIAPDLPHLRPHHRAAPRPGTKSRIPGRSSTGCSANLPRRTD